MSIWTPGQPSRQQQKREIERQQREAAEYRKKMENVSSQFIDFLIENDFTIIDFDNLVNFTRNKFSAFFNNTKIKSLKNGKVEQSNNQSDSE